MVEQLPADEPRYLVLDWEGVNKDERQVSKIFSASRVPDTCKAKTVLHELKQALRNALDGAHLDHQATDYDEITPEEFNERRACEKWPVASANRPSPGPETCRTSVSDPRRRGAR